MSVHRSDINSNVSGNVFKRFYHIYHKTNLHHIATPLRGQKTTDLENMELRHHMVPLGLYHT